MASGGGEELGRTDGVGLSLCRVGPCCVQGRARLCRAGPGCVQRGTVLGAGWAAGWERRAGTCCVQDGAVLYAGWGCAVCRVRCALCRLGPCCMKSWMCSMQGGAVLYAELDVLYAGWGRAVCRVGCALCRLGPCCMKSWMCSMQGGAVLYAELDVLCAGWGWDVCGVRPCRVVLCWMQGEAVQGCAVLDAGWVHRVGSVCVQGVGGVYAG